MVCSLPQKHHEQIGEYVRACNKCKALYYDRRKMEKRKVDLEFETQKLELVDADLKFRLSLLQNAREIPSEWPEEID